MNEIKSIFKYISDTTDYFTPHNIEYLKTKTNVNNFEEKENEDFGISEDSED